MTARGYSQTNSYYQHTALVDEVYITGKDMGFEQYYKIISKVSGLALSTGTGITKNIRLEMLS